MSLLSASIMAVKSINSSRGAAASEVLQFIQATNNPKFQSTTVTEVRDVLRTQVSKGMLLEVCRMNLPYSFFPITSVEPVFVLSSHEDILDIVAEASGL